MANSSILEEMLEHLVNENRTQAEELFHDYVVAKSREIYESLLEESYPGDDDEVDGDEGEFEEAFDFGKPANDDDYEDGEEGEEDEFGEKEFGDDEAESKEEEIFQSLDEIVDELQAKFDELRGINNLEAANDDDFGGDETDELNNEFDDEEEKDESFELETVREYVEKVTVKGGDNGANTKSPAAGAANMGGTASNILNGGTSETGGTQGGLVNPKAQDMKSGNVNVSGGDASKSLKNAPAVKKADDGSNTASLFRKKQ